MKSFEFKTPVGQACTYDQANSVDQRIAPKSVSHAAAGLTSEGLTVACYV